MGNAYKEVLTLIIIQSVLHWIHFPFTEEKHGENQTINNHSTKIDSIEIKPLPSARKNTSHRRSLVR